MRVEDTGGPRAAAGDTLLIYAPVPLFQSQGGGLLLEDQACNGLRLWAANFARLIAMLPLDPGRAPANWRPIEGVGPSLERIEVVPLPMAHRPDRFLRALPRTQARIGALIRRADYLGFAIGGLFGDWGAVACWEAHRQGRPFYVWTDRVESEVTRAAAAAPGPWRGRLRARLTHRPMAALERSVVRRGALGLFHGRETFDAYARFSPNPQVVHDIHLRKADHLPAPAVAAKAAAAGAGPLRLAYVGRADPMKGPRDWVRTLVALAARGVDFQATWLGSGSELPAMRAEVAAAGLGDRIALPGHAEDRARVLELLRGTHAFLFCHLTPESPRCLIEALASAAPIVGYDGAFARDLVAGHGGGILVPRGDVQELAAQLAAVDAARPRLSDLIARAARDGAPFDDETVFRHRSELIRQHLPPRRPARAPGAVPALGG
jgi:glycosyltransferase involved in cell wall biosynthesis